MRYSNWPKDQKLFRMIIFFDIIIYWLSGAPFSATAEALRLLSMRPNQTNSQAAVQSHFAISQTKIQNRVDLDNQPPK